MGKILQGILGGFSGKVGPVVGAKWKDIDYMRSYVIPENPNTAGQQTQRAKFAQCVAYARDLLAGLLQTYWDPFHTSMSGFNAWIKENIGLLQAGNVLDDSAIMAKGTLEGAVITAATYGSLGGDVSCEWSNITTGNGEQTDTAMIVAYDKANKDLFVINPAATRADELAAGTMTAGLTYSNVYVYLFFTRGTGSELVVSDSDGSICASP